MRPFRIGLGSLAVTIGLVGCGQQPPVIGSPGDVVGPTFQTQQAPFGPREVRQCRINPFDTARDIAAKAVGQTVLLYELTVFTDLRDRRLAQRDLARYLLWKHGGPDGLCRAVAVYGENGLARRHRDDAAAFLLGMFDFQEGGPIVILPIWLQDYVIHEAGGWYEPAIIGVLNRFGLSRSLASQLARQLHRHRRGDRSRVSVRLSRDFNLESPFIRSAVRSRRGDVRRDRSGVRLDDRHRPGIGDRPRTPDRRTPDRVDRRMPDRIDRRLPDQIDRQIPDRADRPIPGIGERTLPDVRVRPSDRLQPGIGERQDLGPRLGEQAGRGLREGQERGPGNLLRRQIGDQRGPGPQAES